MIAYLDTSFLIKIYVPETESDEVAAILTGLQGAGTVSRLTDVEIASTLHRRLPTQDIAKAYLDYRQDRRDELYRELAINDQVFDLAKTFAERYAGRFHLRSLDILHLAIAVHHEATAFATYDRRLAEAAVALGLQKLPVSS